MPIVPQPHGGAIFQAPKGYTSNPHGRPKIPKTIKEFIKELEQVDDDFLLPVEACQEIVEKDGKKFYKVKGTNGQKMVMAQLQKAFKGDQKALDWLTKMGYAGGYEPVKNENTNTNLNTDVEIVIRNENTD